MPSKNETPLGTPTPPQHTSASDATKCRTFSPPDVETSGDALLQSTYALVASRIPEPSLVPYMDALAERTAIIREWNLSLEDTPILLTPVSFDPPLPHDVSSFTTEQHSRVYEAMMPVSVVPVLGFRALSTPTGFINHLPSGVQLVAARFREDLILNAAEAIESDYPSLIPLDPN